MQHMHEEMINRGVKIIDIDAIKLTGINPDTRTELPKPFVDSISEHGVLTPVVVNQDNVLVDGHRRCQACRQIGLAQVPSITLHGDPIKLFTRFNEHTRPITGTQWTQVRMRGGVIPERYEQQYKRLSTLFTKEEIEALYQKRPFSAAMVNDVRYIAKHIGEMTDEKQREIFRWIVQHGVQVKMVRDAIRNRVAPEVLEVAIREGKPVRMSVAITD